VVSQFVFVYRLLIFTLFW